ncbi:MAG TPA: aspartate aminotransferase family protein [Dongiaceae bacterium]|jgi:acetylornithine/N-succinyldiaminopimelate aminotransferase|nr:aspartate aminotransferase family protein [Dongiaceae bacterium]
MTHLMPTYKPADLVFAHGAGSTLFTADGAAYLDFTSGIAVTNLGHCHPHLVAILRGQAEKLWHCSNLFRVPSAEKLAERLCAASFAERVFFSNSGTEAIEGALKLTRRYFHGKGQKQRYRVITCAGAFHGRTLAALAAAGNPKYLQGYDPVTEGFDQVPFGDAGAAERAITAETAAILLEPVQGEGGFKAAAPEYLRALRALADRHGLLLIFDEVQCGMGRTGKLFAHQHASVTPDIMAIAKGIGNGYPLGAILATQEVGEAFTYGTHGSTFGGNPLATAIGNGVLDIMLAPGFLESVARKADRLEAGLNRLHRRHENKVGELRGKGLMRGLRLTDKYDPVALSALLRERRVLTLSAGENVLRLLPPLIVTEAELDQGLVVIDDALAAL